MNQIAVVLGMHRSGTSLVSKALSIVGFEHSDNLMPGDGNNPKGYFEDLDIVQLNEAILKRLGKSWDNYSIDSGLLETKSEFFDAARNLVKNKTIITPNLILKDPRISQLIPFWSKVFASLEGTKTKYIHVVRNPEDVARSLIMRNGESREFWLDLWYETEIKIITAGLGQSLYQIEPEKLFDDPAVELRRIAEFCSTDLDGTRAEQFIEIFLDQNLFHDSALQAKGEDEHPALELFKLLKKKSQVSTQDLEVIGHRFDTSYWLRRIAATTVDTSSEIGALQDWRDALLQSKLWRTTKPLKKFSDGRLPKKLNI